jgi:methionine-S-sulfoxide reductase
MTEHEGPTAVATLGGGCFWCVEAVFERVDGVLDVTSGYSGGAADTADYRAVCSGTTDHAEVCRITFDPERLSYRDVLAVFFKAHDPTTLDRQGNDVGRQYRSAIFWHDEMQRAEAEAVVKELDAAGVFPGPIVTEIVPFESFHPAESYHQDYFRRNPGQGYCQVVIAPKVAKIEALLKETGPAGK